MRDVLGAKYRKNLQKRAVTQGFDCVYDPHAPYC
jgi:hypothetical protein